MGIESRCEHCGADYYMVDRLAGKLVRCRRCRQVFRVIRKPVPVAPPLAVRAAPRAGPALPALEPPPLDPLDPLPLDAALGQPFTGIAPSGNAHDPETLGVHQPDVPQASGGPDFSPLDVAGPAGLWRWVFIAVLVIGFAGFFHYWVAVAVLVMLLFVGVSYALVGVGWWIKEAVTNGLEPVYIFIPGYHFWYTSQHWLSMRLPSWAVLRGTVLLVLAGAVGLAASYMAPARTQSPIASNTGGGRNITQQGPTGSGSVDTTAQTSPVTPSNTGAGRPRPVTPSPTTGPSSTPVEPPSPPVIIDIAADPFLESRLGAPERLGAYELYLPQKGGPVRIAQYEIRPPADWEIDPAVKRRGNLEWRPPRAAPSLWGPKLHVSVIPRAAYGAPKPAVRTDVDAADARELGPQTLAAKGATVDLVRMNGLTFTRVRGTDDSLSYVTYIGDTYVTIHAIPPEDGKDKEVLKLMDTAARTFRKVGE